MSNDMESQLGSYIIQQDYKVCPECAGELEYKGMGSFECKKCGHRELTNYGKVKEYLDNHENVTLLELSHGTGLRFAEVRDIVKQMGAL